MATIPLMQDQDDDVESSNEKDLPSYEEARTRSQPFDPAQTRFFSGMRTTGAVEKDAAVAGAHVAIRLAFLRKVFGILSFQLGGTFLFAAVLYLTPGVRGFIQQQPWIILTCLFGSIGLLFAMFVHARTVPLNYFLLVGWTVMQALTVGGVVTFYDADVVIQALLITTMVVGGLFAYTLQSKHDFQKHYAIIFTVSCVFIMATMLQIFLMSRAFDFIISIGGALLFSVYLVFDIDAIMHLYSEEDYILACLSIYMDIIGLFLRILEIVNEINRN